MNVQLGERSYSILIGRNLLKQLPARLDAVPDGAKIAVCANARIHALYGDDLTRSLRDAGYDAWQAELPDGEEHKTLRTAAALIDQFVEHGMDRSSFAAALGGGVTGDTAGFAAAAYMRGIPLLQIPTTLIAQVDSSVGGKTAVDHPKGKNLIGAFHQPRQVLIDVDALSTLPEREFAAGIAEVMRYGVIASPSLFETLETRMEAFLRRDPELLMEAVAECCAVKARIVEEDERGDRRPRDVELRTHVRACAGNGDRLHALFAWRGGRHRDGVRRGDVRRARSGGPRILRPPPGGSRIGRAAVFVSERCVGAARVEGDEDRQEGAARASAVHRVAWGRICGGAGRLHRRGGAGGDGSGKTMSGSKHVLLIHGPNLQLLGRRRPEIYGSATLKQINAELTEAAEAAGLRLTCFQSNSEGELADFIGSHLGKADGAIINPAAYTHTSVALRDALEALEVPVIEAHLSNIAARESFRSRSFIAPIAVGSIAGFGAESYRLALRAMIHILSC